MSADTVPLPTAVGPARTVNRRRPPCSTTSAVETLDERRDLVGAQAAHPARLGDPDLLHDLAGPHLADAGQRLEQRGDLDLADHLVALAFLDHFAEGALRVLQPVLHLGAGAPRGGG